MAKWNLSRTARLAVAAAVFAVAPSCAVYEEVVTGLGVAAATCSGEIIVTTTEENVSGDPRLCTPERRDCSFRAAMETVAACHDLIEQPYAIRLASGEAYPLTDQPDAPLQDIEIDLAITSSGENGPATLAFATPFYGFRVNGGRLSLENVALDGAGGMTVDGAVALKNVVFRNVDGGIAIGETGFDNALEGENVSFLFDEGSTRGAGVSVFNFCRPCVIRGLRVQGSSRFTLQAALEEADGGAQALSILPFETSGGRTPSSIAAGSIEISSRRMPVVIEGAHIVGAEGVTVVGAGAGPSRISIRQSLFQRNASIALIAGDAGFEGDVILSDTTMHDNGAILFRGRGFPPSLTVLRAGYLTLTDNDAITIERITDGASLSIANSIFFGNGAVACRYTPDEPDVSPTIRLASLGPDGAENCIFDVSGDPTLGPLQANPGPLATLTRLPAAGSVVIDRATFCPDGSTDQRGVARPVGAACDFGAVERD